MWHIWGRRKERKMERDDRDMKGDGEPATEGPSDGPAREEGEATDLGSTSQDQPGGES